MWAENNCCLYVRVECSTCKAPVAQADCLECTGSDDDAAVLLCLKCAFTKAGGMVKVSYCWFCSLYIMFNMLVLFVGTWTGGTNRTWSKYGAHCEEWAAYNWCAQWNVSAQSQWNVNATTPMAGTYLQLDWSTYIHKYRKNISVFATLYVVCILVCY